MTGKVGASPSTIQSTEIADKRILDIHDLFMEAEEELKKAEQQCRRLSIPSINELRYAGNHLLLALITPDQADYNFQEAESHCKRAIFDAVEIRLLDYLNRIDFIERDFRSIEIGKRVPKYHELRKGYLAVKKTLEAVGAKRKTREQYLEKCKEHLIHLDAYSSALDSALPDLQKALANARFTVLTTVAILLAGVLAVFFAMTGPVFPDFWIKHSTDQPALKAPSD